MNITPAPDVLKALTSVWRWIGVPEAEAQCTSSLVSLTRSAIGRAEVMVAFTSLIAAASETAAASEKLELIRIGGCGPVGMVGRLICAGDLARRTGFDALFVRRIEAAPAFINYLLFSSAVERKRSRSDAERLRHDAGERSLEQFA
jgi:hypothetical protein